MTTARTRPDEEFDGWAIAPPTGEWEYELDDFGATFGPGWWPFYKEGHPAAVRLAPNTAYQSWRNEYVTLWNNSEAIAHADLKLWRRPQGMGGMIGRARVTIDIRNKRVTISAGCPADLREQAEAKAERLLRFILMARRERRAGRRLITAHERYEAERADDAG
jgi:hypothetical protein